jgi:Tol biopolymer transport system component
MRRLTRTRSINERAPAWNPQRREIAFVKYAPKDTGGAIWLMNLADRSTTRLTKPAEETDDLSWAPGGHRLAFVKAHGKEPDVYIVTRSGRQRQITSTPATEYGVDWSRGREAPRLRVRPWRRDGGEDSQLEVGPSSRRRS